MPISKLLIIDDDQALCSLLSEYLNREGFDTHFCCHITQTIGTWIDELNPDLIILDIMMPGLSGLDLLKLIRAQAYYRPVIMLTGRGDELDRILGLELGADDYLTKPCNPRELSARCKAVLRRHQPLTTTDVALTETVPLTLGPLKLDLNTRTAYLSTHPLTLTAAEFRLLHVLMENSKQLLRKDYLTVQVLQRKLDKYDRSIDVHISRLRQKIQSINGISTGLIIKSERTLGYQLIMDTQIL